jgi:hypothetical protein
MAEPKTTRSKTQAPSSRSYRGPSGAERRDKSKVTEVASLDDEAWRAEVQRGVKAAQTLMADPTGAHTAITPARLLPEAVEFLATHLPEDYRRIAKQFDFSKKRGAISVSLPVSERLAELSVQFAEGTEYEAIFKRNLVIVALYLYAKELQAQARLRTYLFTAEYLKDALSAPDVLDRVQAKTNITRQRLTDLARGGPAVAREIEGGGLVEVVQILEAIGKKPMDLIFAAANASDEADFRSRADAQGAVAS